MAQCSVCSADVQQWDQSEAGEQICPECGAVQGSAVAEADGSAGDESAPEVGEVEDNAVPEESEDAAAVTVTAKLLHQQTQTEFSLPDADVTVGRDATGHQHDVDLSTLPEDEAQLVSRGHARIYKDGDGWHIVEDKETTNGTRVNKVQLSPQQPQEINDGDEIEIASSVFTFKLNQPSN